MNAQVVSPPFVIAIDGPAGSGKTTTAKGVAKKLGFIYIDTGAMYRAVGYAVRAKGFAMDDEGSICALMRELNIVLRIGGNGQETILNGTNVESAIRTPEIARAASDVSRIPCVREAMVDLQRAAAAGAPGAVLEGRDIGTVVFPNAPLKIYLTADVRSRAERRLREMREAGTDIPLETLILQIAERDRNDSTRAHSPLRKAGDAIEIDTTHLTIPEQVDAIYALARTRMMKAVSNEQ